MNDKTAIEAIRALKRYVENDMPEYDYGWDAAIDEAIKAIAALDAEKPGEDIEAEDVAIRIFNELNGSADDIPECTRLILYYAVRYHAAQCKVCNDFCSRAKEHCEDRESPIV